MKKVLINSLLIILIAFAPMMTFAGAHSAAKSDEAKASEKAEVAEKLKKEEKKAIKAAVVKSAILKAEQALEAKPKLERKARKEMTRTEVKAYKAERKDLKAQVRKTKYMGLMAAAGDGDIIAILLCLFLGGLAIHRVFLGGSPILILGYLLTAGGIFWILPFIELIRMILGDVDHFSGNDAFFAAFK